mmetsp:Transcript_6354/g.15301  ORF Transcript_6354/g.15301 Transcript_6354/m.15301 type:complete len:208 (-) Transcript_6354:2308-2931(-)
MDATFRCIPKSCKLPGGACPKPALGATTGSRTGIGGGPTTTGSRTYCCALQGPGCAWNELKCLTGPGAAPSLRAASPSRPESTGSEASCVGVAPEDDCLLLIPDAPWKEDASLHGSSVLNDRSAARTSGLEPGASLAFVSFASSMLRSKRFRCSSPALTRYLSCSDLSETDLLTCSSSSRRNAFSRSRFCLDVRWFAFAWFNRVVPS